MVVSSWRTGIAMVKSATESGSRCLLPQCTLWWVLLPTLAANLRAGVARQAGQSPSALRRLLGACAEERGFRRAAGGPVAGRHDRTLAVAYATAGAAIQITLRYVLLLCMDNR